MFLAPGILVRSFQFGNHSGPINVTKDSSLDGIVKVVVSNFGQDPKFFSCSLEGEVYVIRERRNNFPKTLDEWKKPGFIFGVCDNKVPTEYKDILIPDLEYFVKNGKTHFCFPENYMKTKKTPQTYVKVKNGSYYVNPEGKCGYIPSGILGDSVAVAPPPPQNPKKTPKTIPELKALAMETKKNTEDALKQMKDELRRSSGKIVAGDNLAVPQYRNEYSLDPKNIVVRLPEEDENSVSSDTVSSSEEE